MKTETVPVDSLVFDPANARKHGEKNLAAIKGSLLRFGQQKPIVVDAKGIVRAGNGTLAALIALGWKEAVIVRSSLTGSEATAYAIADNRTAELAEWDDDTLKQTIAALQIEDEDLAEASGFDEKEIDALLVPDAVEDEVPAPPVDPITKTGDLWLLGAHRVLCGDSTKRYDVERLMDGGSADICFTSPPYALGKSVSLRGNTSMGIKGNAYDTHDDNPEKWMQLMDGWWESSVGIVRHAWIVNIQPLAGNKVNLFRWINARVTRLIDVVTWDKGRAAPQMAHGVLASRYEWFIGFGSVNASRAFPLSSWRGTLQSLYESPPQTKNEYADIHAATMPVSVPVWVMGSLCDLCESVYDPFAGTGTTLIAAEQLKRKCYGMEISPAYCDVIVKRWETLTGRKAVIERREDVST